MKDHAPASTNRPPTIDAAGRVLGLAAILVPAIGAGSRYVAIGLVPGPAPAASIAASTPLPELAFFGTFAWVLMSGFMYPFLLARSLARSLAPMERIKDEIGDARERLEDVRDMWDGLPPDVQNWTAADFEDGSPAMRDAPPETVATVEAALEGLREVDRDADKIIEDLHASRSIGWAKLIPERRGARFAIHAALAAVSVALAVSVPLVLLLVGGAVVLIQDAYYSRLVRERGEVSWAHAWPGAIVVALASVFFFGFVSFGTGADAGRFELDGRIPNGMYAHLGSAHGLTYLRACDHPNGDDAPVLAVPPDAIELVESIRLDEVDMPPSLWAMIVRGEPFSIANDLRCVEGAAR